MDDPHIVDRSVQNRKKQPYPCELSPTRVNASVICPRCHQADLDYNGLLQLVCPCCGVVEAGTST